MQKARFLSIYIIIFTFFLVSMSKNSEILARGPTFRISPEAGYGFMGFIQFNTTHATTEDTSEYSDLEDETINQNRQFFGPEYSLHFSFENNAKRTPIYGIETGYHIMMLDQKAIGKMLSPAILIHGASLGLFLRPNQFSVFRLNGIFKYGSSEEETVPFFDEDDNDPTKAPLSFLSYGADISFGGVIPIPNKRKDLVFIDFSFHYVPTYIIEVDKKSIDNLTRIDAYLFSIRFNVPVN